MEERFAGGDNARIVEFANELARSKVRMILANTSRRRARRPHALIRPVPVLITAMNDPVGAGLVSSLAKSRQPHVRHCEFEPGPDPEDAWSSCAR